MSTNIQPIPYLFFDGNCADAIRFYESTLGGTIKSTMLYKDLPAEATPVDDPMRLTFGDRIMNTQLELPGGSYIYASDAHPTMQHHGVNGFSLALNFDSADEAEEMFNKLADGGSVQMPFSPSFWAEKFGMLTDKFGIEWMINGNLQSE
jgi:PhnB protein